MSQGFASAACVGAVQSSIGTECGCDRLERAVAAGFGNLKWIENDPDFESLRDPPRFRAVVGAAG